MAEPKNRRLITEDRFEELQSTLYPHRELTFSNLSTWSTSYTGRRPNVAVYVGGEEVDTDVFANNGTISVTFAAPATGTLVLS